MGFSLRNGTVVFALAVDAHDTRRIGIKKRVFVARIAMRFYERFGVHGVTAVCVPEMAIYARYRKAARARFCTATHFDQRLIGALHAAAHANCAENRFVPAPLGIDVREKHQIRKVLSETAVLM